MIRNNRIIWSDNGTLIDLSDRLNDFSESSQVIPFVAAEDAIYIGSLLPFNHRYFQLNVVNTAATAISISLWDGSSWKSAIDVLDQTRDSTRTKSLAQSGIISWQKQINENWSRDNTDEMTGSGLTSLKIYDLYWAKLTWSGDWSLTTDISFLGHKFSDDVNLAQLYPDLNKAGVKTQFLAGKTDWNDQHLWAALIIIRDMMSLDYAISPNQILRWDLFKEASVHKVAEIIFNSQGDDEKDNRDKAREYYDEAMKLINPQMDQNANTNLDINESLPSFKVTRR